jgi:hypothetical protein
MNRNNGRIHTPPNALDGRQARLAVRAAMAEIDPDLPLSDVRTMEERTTLSMSPRRTALLLAMAFGGLEKARSIARLFLVPGISH